MKYFYEDEKCIQAECEYCGTILDIPKWRCAKVQGGYTLNVGSQCYACGHISNVIVRGNSLLVDSEVGDLYEEASPSQPEVKKKNNNVLIFTVVGILAFICICCPLIYSSSNTVSKNINKPDARAATEICKDAVKDRLKSPSTAEFPNVLAKNVIDENTFSLDSYVDSENGFGAMLRANFHCKVKYLSKGKWELISMLIY